MSEHTPTQGPWKVREWSMDRDTQESSGSIYAEPRDGHAYAVAMCPRYQTQERWNADAALIVSAVNSLASNEAKIDALTKALEAYEVAIDEAEAIFGGEYADHYGPMFEKAMAARDARRVALSSHTEQEGGGVTDTRKDRQNGEPRA